MVEEETRLYLSAKAAEQIKHTATIRKDEPVMAGLKKKRNDVRAEKRAGKAALLNAAVRSESELLEALDHMDAHLSKLTHAQNVYQQALSTHTAVKAELEAKLAHHKAAVIDAERLLSELVQPAEPKQETVEQVECRTRICREAMEQAWANLCRDGLYSRGGAQHARQKHGTNGLRGRVKRTLGD